MFEGEMIDEASRKMAKQVAARGRAARARSSVTLPFSRPPRHLRRTVRGGRGRLDADAAARRRLARCPDSDASTTDLRFLFCTNHRAPVASAKTTRTDFSEFSDDQSVFELSHAVFPSASGAPSKFANRHSNRRSRRCVSAATSRSKSRRTWK